MMTKTRAPVRLVATHVSKEEHMTRTVRTAVALLACAALLAPAPVQALGPSVATEGAVLQIGAFVPVPVENIRHMVPESFVIAGEETGVATILVTIGHGPRWLLDGRLAKPLTFGLVTVIGAHPRDREPGVDVYDLWWSFGHSDTTSRWRSLGIFSETVQGMRFDLDRGPTGGVTGASGSVPDGYSPFSMETAVVDPMARPGQPDSQATHWYEGPKGRVRGDHWNTKNELLLGDVTIETPAGSPLAEILGATSVTLPGGISDFHHEAVTYLTGE